MRVIVVGAGIGGLVAARSLSRAGVEVTVLERAERFGEVGAGVQLGPNATAVLRGLGLGDGLDQVGVEPESFRQVRWADGAVLDDHRLAEAARERFGAPYYTLYRPDLIELLASGLPDGLVRLGSPVTEVIAGDRPSVRLADGTVESADVLVGADGTHSVVRAATVGDVPARFSGMAAYRALVPRERVPEVYWPAGAAPVVRNWFGPGQHLIAYPVGEGARYLNLVAVVAEPSWTTESWTAKGSAADLRSRFDGWAPELRELLDAVSDPVYRWALYDREPLPRWSTGSTTLLGDACHPMLPFMAQGAAQAVEDAAALTAALRDAQRYPAPAGAPARAAALDRYQRARQPRTARIQRLSWSNNIRYHLPDGPEQRERDERLSVQRTEETLRWLYANDPELLPAR